LNLYVFVGNDGVGNWDLLGLTWYNPWTWFNDNEHSTDRDDDSWNDPAHRYADNCYEYARDKHGNFTDPNNSSSFKNPGDESGNPITSMNQLTCADIISRAKADGMVDCCKDGDDISCPDGFHLVYLVVDDTDDPSVSGDDRDYHWYRRDTLPWYNFWSEHSWSHKRGTGSVLERDASGNKIIDPSKADTDYTYEGRGGNYTKKCGYLCSP